MELFDGRPLDTMGRPEKEIRVYDLLDSLGIEYKRTDHEPTNTIAACNGVDEILEVSICKNLFLCNRQKTAYYLLMIPGEKAFRTKELSSQINSSRLSFAPAEDMEAYLDIQPGSVSIMGLMNDTENHVKLLVDREVLEGEFIGCHPCVNTASLKLKTKDVFERFLKAVHHDFTVVTLQGSQE